MDKLLHFIVLALCLTWAIRADEDGCKVKLPNDIPNKEPVYLVSNEAGNLSLYDPVDSYLNVQYNKNLYMFCAGRRNTFHDDFNNLHTVLCNQNDKFEINSVEVDFEKLYCESKSTGDVRLTKTTCAKGKGVVNEIGFQVSSSEFVKLFEVCYNNDTASAIYSKHYINGKAIEFNVKESSRPSFQESGIPNTIRPSVLYKQAAIEKHFTKILGSTQTYFRTPKTLSRGHLTPDGDYIFRTEQFATYFYLNVVPKFQVINNGNWKAVENIVRKLASWHKRDLLIYTGTYQQLELPDRKGEQIPLWLDQDNHIAVPKYIWKIVIDEKDNTGIAFVTLNNPYANQKQVDAICHDICDQTHMRTKGFMKVTNGYTICCDVNELAEIIGILPTTLHVDGLLDSVT